MSKRVIGLILSLVGSLVIGILAGQKFYAIFDKTVPAGSMTELVRAGTHTAYLVSGAALGVVIFAWTTAAAWLARFFPAGSAPSSSTSAQPAK